MRGTSPQQDRVLPSAASASESPQLDTLVALTLPPPGATKETERGAAVQKLVSEVLDPKSPLRISSLRTLRDLDGLSNLVNAVSADLRTPNEETRARAALVLRNVCTLPELNASRNVSAESKSAAAQALLTFLSDPASRLGSGIRYTAGTDAVSALKTLLPVIPQREAMTIVNSLVGIASNKGLSENHRLRAVEALAGLSESRSSALVARAVPGLLTAMLTDNSGVVRYSAALSIGCLPPDRLDAKSRTAVINGLISAVDRTTGMHQSTVRQNAAIAIGRLGVGHTEGAAAVAALRRPLAIHAGSTADERSMASTSLAALYHLSKKEPGATFAAAAIPDLISALRLRDPGPGVPRMLGHYFYAAKALGELAPHLGSRRREVANEMITALTEVADKRYNDANHVSVPSIIALGRMGREGGAAIPILTRMLQTTTCRVEAMEAIRNVLPHSNSPMARSEAVRAITACLGDKVNIVRTTAFDTMKSLLSELPRRDPASIEAVKILRGLASDRTKPGAIPAALLINGFDARRP